MNTLTNVGDKLRKLTIDGRINMKQRDEILTKLPEQNNMWLFVANMLEGDNLYDFIKELIPKGTD